MKLLEEIIEAATSDAEQLPALLRRCLILSYALNNDALKQWVTKELNGYEYFEELPDYRKGYGIARGFFVGPFNSSIDNQPLPASILNDEHRHFAHEIRLNQPIAAYDVNTAKDGMALPWPADLVAKYQNKFLDGWALNRAWLEIPYSMIAGAVDAVRTRVLTFALEIRQSVPSDDPSALKEIPSSAVDQLVQVLIFGGNNVIGSVERFSPLLVMAGDAQSLAKQLNALGLEPDDIDGLQTSISNDALENPAGSETKSLGSRTAAWIKEAANKTANGALKITGAVAEEAIKAAVMKYLGL